MEHRRNNKLMLKVLMVGLVIAILSYLFHPDVGQFSIMINGEPVADPLVHFAAIPAFLVIMLMTGVLMLLLFLGVGVFIFMTATFIALLGIAIAAPFFWPILLIIFLIIALII
ncbi:MAG: hypothetical protein CVV13_12925 [Gammaproteobacteria bacterium HGW-Gammaproteobacteria-3]|nr:MAG: hypothetical protein CVV13_12925 [Gammaproteobacteria bacterium HGW-Gammaproteobacteria-3]